jgi:hypothetical protein
MVVKLFSEDYPLYIFLCDKILFDRENRREVQDMSSLCTFDFQFYVDQLLNGVKTHIYNYTPTPTYPPVHQLTHTDSYIMIHYGA